MNALDDVILVARYGSRYRWTLNLLARRVGNGGWDAGPASDWCEVADEGSLNRARTAAGAIARDRGASRIRRQIAAHESGHCTRPDGHWPAPSVDGSA